MNLFQILIKNIEIEKVRCVFQISLNDFIVSGIEVIALDVWFLSTVDCLKTFIYLCHTVEIDSCCCKITVMFNAIFTVYGPNSAK